MKRDAIRLMMLCLLCALAVSLLPISAMATGETVPVTGVDGVTVGACSNGTATESNGTVTVTVKGTGTTRKQTTVTVTNTSGSTATISFDYSVSDHDSSVSTIDDLAGADSGSYSVLLTAGATKTFVISSKRGYPFVYTATATLSNFKVEIAAVTSNVTVTYGSNGSVTIDGIAVSSGTATSLSSASAHRLVATPVSGASFLGWIDGSNNLLTTSTTYSLTPTEDVSIQAVFVNNTSDTAWFDVDGKYLTSDLNFASANGTKIVLLNNGTLAAGNYTIGSGDTLLIPFDEAHTVFTTNHQTGGLIKDNPGLTAGSAGATGPYRTLTMASGANITVNGNLCLPAKLSAANGAMYNAGSPIGEVPYIVMEGTSNITLNSGANLYCYGFITGSGTVTVSSGAKVYECFQFQDFRGGSCCSELESNKTTYAVFPTSQYFIQNVEVPMTVKSGGSLIGVSAVDVSITGIVYMDNIGIIGTSGSLFANSGDVTMRYDGSRDRLIVDIDGDAALGGITLNFGQLGVSIASADYVLGLCNNMTVNINSGTVTSNQRLGLQAGVEINIAEGAGLILNKDMHVYDASEWGQFCFSSGLKGILDLTQIADVYKSDISAGENYGAFAVSFAPGRTYTRTWADLKDAVIDVNGTLTATSANLYTTKSGACIISSQGTGTVTLAAGSQKIAYQIEEVAGGDWDTYEIPLTPAQLKNSDGSYVQSVTDTYTYVDGYWRCANHTFENGICTVCGCYLFEFTAANVILGNNLDMAFAFTYNGTDTLTAESGYYVELKRSVAGGTTKTVTYEFGEWTTNNGFYVVEYGELAAKEMCDTITLTVYNAENMQVSNIWIDSMQEYAMRQIEKYEKKEVSTEKDLILTVLVDMLNYGSEAQKRFDYDIDNLANSKLTDTQKGYATSEVTKDATESTLTTPWVASNLVTTSNIQFLMAFSDIQDGATVTITYKDHYDKEQTVNISTFSVNNGVKYITIDALVVADAWQIMTVVLKNNGEEYTFTESIAGYLSRYTEHGDLNAAFLKFAESAYNYFEYKKSTETA